MELIGGDRLPGRIVEFLPEATDGIDRPASLVVEPKLTVDEPVADEPVRIRVPIERVRRVVWNETTPRAFRPGTFFYRDGRRTSFRSLRWAPGVVRLLVDQGIEEVAWDDAAEVHLPERDPWEEYADQLAILLPGITTTTGAAAAKPGTPRLIRFETPGGLCVTVSSERLRAYGDVAKADSQRFEVHPAWSLDPIALPQRLVSSQTFFAEHELPLSNFEPTGYVHRPILGGGWNQWRADRNVQGNPLGAADREFGWGFGIHAYAALQFDLPASARAFRTHVALDRAVGDGGCVRGRIYFGVSPTAAAVSGRPLYESPVLVGSQQVHDSGRLELRPVFGRENRLVLVVDPLADGTAPPQADPLDLRDMFDWLEPIVELDPATLRTAATKHAASLFVRQHRWVIQGPYGEAWHWENFGANGRRRLVVAVKKQPLSITRNLSVPTDCEALNVHVGMVDDVAGTATVKLIVGGKTLVEANLSKTGDPVKPPLVKLSVPADQRGREVRYELVFAAPKPGLRLDFYGVGLPVPAAPAAK